MRLPRQQNQALRGSGGTASRAGVPVIGGIGLTAYGVLSRGLLGGSRPAGPSDFRTYLPRFSGDNLAGNQRLADALAALGRARGATAAQLAIAGCSHAARTSCR